MWNELPVVVTFESHWREARELLIAIAQEHGQVPQLESMPRANRLAQEYMLLPTSVGPKVFVSLEDIGVGLTLRYLCLPSERRSSAERIWIEVLDAFAGREDIDFAYPTVRYFDNRTEGKGVK